MLPSLHATLGPTAERTVPLVVVVVVCYVWLQRRFARLLGPRVPIKGPIGAPPGAPNGALKAPKDHKMAQSPLQDPFAPLCEPYVASMCPLPPRGRPMWALFGP